MFILGTAQTDFARHLAREGKELGDLIGEVIDAALADAGLDAAAIQTIHVGNAFGQLFTGQGHLGAMAATVRPALSGKPAARHEGACASGSLAILAAQAELAAGYYDVALVIGAEQERNVPGDQCARFLGAAAHVGHEATEATYAWPYLFSQIADAYAERHGLETAHLEAIAAKNYAAAKANPLAQTRGWTIDRAAFASSPVVEGRLRRHDCAQVTDGAAAIVLASPRFGRTKAPRILGWGHTTVDLPLAPKLAHRDPSGLMFPFMAVAAAEARRRAQIAEPAAYEVHDCFTITEYVAYEHLGLAPPGRAFRAIEDGSFARVNRTGGLIGIGHPVGATGVRMVVDAARASAAGAGPVQTLNLGGSAATVASFVIGV